MEKLIATWEPLAESPTERGEQQACLAATLLLSQDTLISGVTFVGLPGRESVHVAEAARQLRLDVTVTRNVQGEARIGLTPRSPAALRSRLEAAPVPERSGVGARLRRWLGHSLLLSEEGAR